MTKDPLTVLSPVLFAVYIDDICKLSNVILGTTVVLYADDILLIAPSVSLSVAKVTVGL